MPRKAVDYSKTIIYKIVCNDLSVTDVYIGHTTDFTKRKNAHKTCCNNQNDKSHNFKVYQMIRQNGGWDNWSIVEIEKFCCKDGNEAKARERYWLESLNSNMNTRIPNRSNSEYYQANKTTICEKQLAYYHANREKKSEYKYAYYQANKEKFTENNKAYYQSNKEKLNEKFNCECGGKYMFQSKSYHLKTQKHQNYIQSLVNENNII
jgi:hypothetical protein